MTPRPIRVGDKMQELYERWDTPRLAPRRGHVVRDMKFIIIPTVVLPKENLHSTPRALDSVCVCAGVWINELNTVINGLMRVTVRTQTVVRTPAITNDRSAGFDPVTYNGH
jgi:hypothetical protein